jgi:hypothetical protein
VLKTTDAPGRKRKSENEKRRLLVLHCAGQDLAPEAIRFSDGSPFLQHLLMERPR